MRKFVAAVALLLVVMGLWSACSGDASAPQAGDSTTDVRDVHRDVAVSDLARGDPDRPSGTTRDAPTGARRRGATRATRGALGGLVVMPDGTPAAGAEVLGYPAEAEPWRTVSVHTDDAGRFPVEVFRDHDLLAFWEGRGCSDVTHVPSTATALTVTLRDGASVTGRVRYADGRPAPSVRLLVQFIAARGGSMDGAWELRSDQDGRYRFAGIPEGWWVRPCVGWGDRHGPADAASGRLWFSDRDSALADGGEMHRVGGDEDVLVRDLTARYFPGARVTFELRFPDGASIPTDVQFETWDSDGSGYSMGPRTISPREPRLTEVLDLGEEMEIRVRAGPYVGETSRLRYDTEQEDTVVVEMRPAQRVVAQLRNPDGSLAARADVEIHVGFWRETTGSGFGVALTDDGGRAELTDVLPFPNLLDTQGAGIAFALKGVDVVRVDLLGDSPNLRIEGADLAARMRSASGPLLLDIPLIEPQRLVVRTVDSGGRPVSAVPLETQGDGVLWPESVTTDADGLATFDVLALPGDRSAWNQAAVHARGEWRGVHVPGSGAEGDRWGGAVDLVVTRLNMYRVRIVDGAGATVSGIRSVYGGSEPVRTEANGVATVRAQPGVVLRVIGPDYTGRGDPLPEGDADVTLVVRAMRSVTVRVEHPEPAWRGKLSCRAKWEPAGGLFMNAERRAAVPPRLSMSLPLAPVEIRVTSEDRLWEGVALVATDADEATVRLERRPLHPVRIRVMSPTGDAVVTTRIRLRVQGATHLLDGEFVTDMNGEVRFELPAGRYKSVEIQVADEAWDSVRATVPTESVITHQMGARW